MDLKSHRVKRENKNIRLGPKEYQLLKLFLENFPYLWLDLFFIIFLIILILNGQKDLIIFLDYLKITNQLTSQSR